MFDYFLRNFTSPVYHSSDIKAYYIEENMNNYNTMYHKCLKDRAYKVYLPKKPIMKVMM